MCVLMIAAIVFGGLIGGACAGIQGLAWLGYYKDFAMTPTTFNVDLFSLTFGFSFKAYVAQLILIIVGIVIYTKLAPKVITGK